MKNYFYQARLVIALVFCSVSFLSFGQQFSVKAGMNISTFSMESGGIDYSDEYDSKPGFHIGAYYDLSFNDVLSFEPGLLFTTKGFKINQEDDGASLEQNFNTSYLDVPLSLKASFPIGSSAKVYGSAGPYLGFGLSGKSKITYEDEDGKISVEEDVEWGSDEENDDLKRFDAGLTFGLGFEVSSFIIGASYDLGLSNISAYQEDDTKAKNRVFKISLGYKFGN